MLLLMLLLRFVYKSLIYSHSTRDLSAIHSQCWCSMVRTVKPVTRGHLNKCPYMTGVTLVTGIFKCEHFGSEKMQFKHPARCPLNTGFSVLMSSFPIQNSSANHGHIIESRYVTIGCYHVNITLAPLMEIQWTSDLQVIGSNPLRGMFHQ